MKHIPPNEESSELAFIAPGVLIPENTKIMAGAYIHEGVKLSPGCRIGPNVVFEQGGLITVERNVHIGANSTLWPGITLSANCIVRPGTVVLRSVPPAAIVEGNPATIVGYVNTQLPSEDTRPHRQKSGEAPMVKTLCSGGAALHHLNVVPDLRGNLSVGEFDRQIPFIPQRYFVVYGVPSREVRGAHAHRTCHQFLICVNGSCSVVVDDGHYRIEVDLDAPNRGLYLPPMTWGIQYKYSPNAVLLVFASHYYDAEDYIRDYEQFLTLLRQKEKL